MDDLVNQLPCGILLISDVGLIKMVNLTAQQQLGYGPDELTGQPVNQILTLASRLFYQTHVYPLINLHGQVDEVALTLLTRTGERIPVLVNAVRQPQEGSWLIHCVYLPLGQRQHYEAELIQARKDAELARMAVEASETRYRALATELEVRIAERTEELRSANKGLTYVNADLKRSNENLLQFAYIASHDLQEPLRKIQSFSNLLREQYAAPLGDGITYLDRMQAAASRMSTLIRDLLAYSRISTKQNASDKVSLDNVVATVLSDLEVLVLETGAQLDISQLPTLQGDTSQLEQLFQNLLSNALKFRHPGESPEIRITAQEVVATDLSPSVKPTREAKKYYRIDVADNGIGFEEKYLDRIFHVFQRLHGKGEFTGTGIGLAICEKVVANHGGAITASSQPGQGATFSVYLPRPGS